MAHLFRDLSLGHSKRETTPPPPPLTAMPTTNEAAADLPSPLGELASQLSLSELRLTAYEIFVAACRTSSGKPLTFIPNSDSPGHHHSPSSPGLQRSLTSTAASKVKKAFGLKSPSGSTSKKSPGSGSGSGTGKPRRPLTVGELMRSQMGVSEAMDSRVRRALLRIAAAQVGRRIESVVVPLELLQQLKLSDFIDQQEYDAWQKRTLKVLEAGLLLHPRLPLDKSYSAAQRLRQVIQGALDRPIETGKNN